MAEMPLAGIKVLDLTLHRAGPTCARQLADWGADVIKIETPGGSKGDAIGANRMGADYQNLHRNKRGITLNLKSEEGRAIFMSSHDIFRARAIADRVGIMRSGNMLEILERDRLEGVDLEKLYLEYTEQVEAGATSAKVD